MQQPCLIMPQVSAPHCKACPTTGTRRQQQEAAGRRQSCGREGSQGQGSCGCAASGGFPASSHSGPQPEGGHSDAGQQQSERRACPCTGQLLLCCYQQQLTSFGMPPAYGGSCRCPLVVQPGLPHPAAAARAALLPLALPCLPSPRQPRCAEQQHTFNSCTPVESKENQHQRPVAAGQAVLLIRPGCLQERLRTLRVALGSAKMPNMYESAPEGASRDRTPPRVNRTPSRHTQPVQPV